MSRANVLDELEQDITVGVDNIIDMFNKQIVAINNQIEFDSSTAQLIKSLLDAFTCEYNQINDHELYKNLFLKVLRAKQDELLNINQYINVLFEIRQLHSRSRKTQTFLESILLYSTKNCIADTSALVLYLINLIAVWDGWADVNGQYLNHKTMSEPRFDKRTLTAEQKNRVLTILLEKEDIGNLNGEEIANELEVNVKYVMALVKELEKREYIEYIGMAQYYFQVNVTPNGIDFLNGGGFVTELKQNIMRESAQILNSASFGDNASVIIGSGNTQHVSNFIGKGDIGALRKVLENNSVSNEDIVELENVLDNDNPNLNEKKFGTKVSEWMKKMLSKSVDGIWKVGISTAGKVLTDAIEQYYNFKH